MTRWQRLALALVALFAAVVVAVGMSRQQDRLNRADDKVAALADQVRSLGATPVAQPERGAQGPQGAQGERGPGPTDAQIAQAVSSYVAAHPPAPGQPPSAADILAAVTVYCASGACTGPAGTSGAAGDSGAPGPGPTDEQIATAVASYCATGVCKGDTGATGTQGPPGPQGEQGPPGPTCPDGTQLEQHQFFLDPATYFVCTSTTTTSTSTTILGAP